MKQPNDAGLDAAIAKYHQALDLVRAMRWLMASWLLRIAVYTR